MRREPLSVINPVRVYELPDKLSGDVMVERIRARGGNAMVMQRSDGSINVVVSKAPHGAKGFRGR